MPLVIPPGFGSAAIVVNSSDGTAPFITTIGVDLVNAGGDFVNAANAVLGAYQESIGAVTDTDADIVQCVLSVGQDGSGGSVSSTIDASGGGQSGTGMPFAMSAIGNKITNDLGRRGRGRMFLPATLTTSHADQAGNVVSARVTAINDALEQFQELLEGSTAPGSGLVSTPPVLLHATAPTDPTPIVAMQCAPKVGWIGGRIR